LISQLSNDLSDTFKLFRVINFTTRIKNALLELIVKAQSQKSCDWFTDMTPGVLILTLLNIADDTFDFESIF